MNEKALHRSGTEASQGRYFELLPFPLRHAREGIGGKRAAGVLRVSRANYLETYKAAVEKVSLADLGAVAKKYIHPDKLAVLVVGDEPEIKPGLGRVAPGSGASDRHHDSAAERRAVRRRASSEQENGRRPAARPEAGGGDYGCRQRDAPQIAKAEGAAPGRRKAAAAARGLQRRPAW